VLLDHDPTFLIHLVVGVQFARQLPQVLASVIEIDNLNRAREVLMKVALKVKTIFCPR
jgi:hypothetical protein